MERMMRVQDVLLKAMAKKITWWASRRNHRGERRNDAAVA